MNMNDSVRANIDALTTASDELEREATVRPRTRVEPIGAGRAQLLKWLRKTHGWVGLWGAALGLLFGVTGILLDHRAQLKIPAAQVQESTVQLRLPAPAPESPEAMAAWLQHELALDGQANRVRTEPAHRVAWGDRSVMQPAHWSMNFASPKAGVQADYWVGNSHVTVKRSEQNLFGTLNNLHKGMGVGIGWILLADSLGGSMIFLALSGVLLWMLSTRRRMVGSGIALASLASIAVLVTLSMQSM
jgi:hypothetical protein